MSEGASRVFARIGLAATLAVTACENKSPAIAWPKDTVVERCVPGDVARNNSVLRALWDPLAPAVNANATLQSSTHTREGMLAQVTEFTRRALAHGCTEDDINIFFDSLNNLGSKQTSALTPRETRLPRPSWLPARTDICIPENGPADYEENIRRVANYLADVNDLIQIHLGPNAGPEAIAEIDMLIDEQLGTLDTNCRMEYAHEVVRRVQERAKKR
jgi:hypothetical protein